MPIRVLDPKVVSRIAAGEVVERPASVVKELVENSLDAGAGQVSVEVRGGGIDLIRVTDSGEGMAAGEVELAFERYATSKVGQLVDLESISSLGFRGEALPSIAAVAQVDVVTCAAGAAEGTSLTLFDGELESKASRGRAQGTTVTVRNLFRRVPARLKFLKSLPTENSHIANVVTQYALAFPEVKFSLSVDGRKTLRTPGSGQLGDAVVAVYGVEVARHMLEIKGGEKAWDSGEVSPVEVSGMVSLPAVNRSGRGYLSFFVNRRWINSRLLAKAVEEAYHGLLMVGKHPVAVVNISLPPPQVDVNVHPTKTEIKFRNERLVFTTVQKTARRALVEQATVPRIEEVAPAYGPAPQPGLWAPDQGGGVAAAVAAPAPAPAEHMPVLRVVGQLAQSYIVAEGSDGLYLIDQHAAHERVLFEQIKRQMEQRAVEVQGLLEPATIEVSPKQDEVLKADCARFAEFGFDIEPFGERTYLVRTVPSLLSGRDWLTMVRELLDSLSGGGDWIESVAISMACHSAVRAGQSLSDDEMRGLIRQMEQAELPHTCPHGRPTMIHLSLHQLERQFGRTK